MIRRAFPSIALISFSTLLGTGIIIPLIPIYATTLGATGMDIGIILAGYSISRVVALPIISRLSDRYGRKPFILTGLLFYTVLSLGYIFAASVPQLILVRVLHGIAAGMTTPWWSALPAQARA